MNADGTPGPDLRPIGSDALLPLLNAQPDMDSREQIAEALVTGVKALDILTPLGKGQALQVSGPLGAGKTQLCVDAVMGQRGAGVRCVYAAVGCTPEQLQRTVEQLEVHGCMEYTTVVAATSARSLGEQYAAMLMACSVAEATRDAGGHALVVLNDIGVMVRMWEMITVAMAELGSVAVEAETENRLFLEGGAGGDGLDCTSEKVEEEEEEEEQAAEEDGLVEYEGMLVSVAAAQRRRFLSSLIQRCAKMHRRLKGGSMTALLVAPGVPATGHRRHQADSKAQKEKIMQYRHLSEEQKAKLLHALESQARGESGGGSSAPPQHAERESDESESVGHPQELRTEVVEELMSITDGQVVLRAQRDPVTGGVSVDPQLSVSRIGSRAYSPAVAEIAPLVRLELAQAEDAKRYAADAPAKGGVPGKAAQQAQRRAAVVAAALPQPQRTTCPLEDQVVQLMALQEGVLDAVPLDQVSATLTQVTEEVRVLCPMAMEEISKTRRLTGTAKAAIRAALMTSCAEMVAAPFKEVTQ